MPQKGYIPKPPRGTRDIQNQDLQIYDEIISVCKDKFKLRGAKQIDTPIFELNDTFKNLYGDEEKLIYKIDSSSRENVYKKVNSIDDQTIDLQKELGDQDKEELSLRYDLTVPFARFVACNGINLMKKFQIGKVYRMDTPQMEKGRYREFYQCDYDIIGSDQNSQLFEIEVLDLMTDILSTLLGKDMFRIRFNDRELLSDILKGCGLKSKKLKTVCSSLDKMDKHPWSYIENELVNVKNINIDIVAKIKNILDKLTIDTTKQKDGTPQMMQMLELLKSEKLISENIEQRLYLLLNNMLEIGILDFFKFDISLIRGLDYYTGIIYEAEYLDKSIMSFSISGGGRYDKMIGKLSTNNVPAIGLSIGVERIFNILKTTYEKAKINVLQPIVKTYVISPKLRKEENTEENKKKMILERIKLCKELRENGISCDMYHTPNAQMGAQFAYVDKNNIPFIIILGLQEVNKETVNLKNNKTREQQTLTREECVKFLQNNF